MPRIAVKCQFMLLSVCNLSSNAFIMNIGGAQLLSGRVLDSRQGAVGSSLTGVTVLCP